MRFSKGTKKILVAMEIEVNEFFNLIKLMYSDFETGDSKNVIEALNLNNKVSEETLRDFMNIDITLDQELSLKDQDAYLTEVVNSLDLIQKD